MTPSASAAACQAARFRSRAGSAPVNAKKIGTVPGGSVITSRVTNDSPKSCMPSLSTGDSCRPVHTSALSWMDSGDLCRPRSCGLRRAEHRRDYRIHLVDEAGRDDPEADRDGHHDAEEPHIGPPVGRVASHLYL